MPDNGLPATIPPGLERVEPTSLQSVSLLGILGSLRRLIDLTEKQIPAGLVETIVFDQARPLTTTRVPLTIVPAWGSIEIFNDGGVNLLVWVNNGGANPVVITPVDHSQKFDFDYPIIEQVWLQAQSDTCQARVVGTR